MAGERSTDDSKHNKNYLAISSSNTEETKKVNVPRNEAQKRTILVLSFYDALVRNQLLLLHGRLYSESFSL